MIQWPLRGVFKGSGRRDKNCECDDMLSILVPVYNVEKYLKECIDSILRQKYEDWESVLVDDGSTDRSGDICDAYAQMDERIRVIHKKNGGLASARLAGIRAARGEYLSFFDSDDWADGDMFMRLMEPLLKMRDVDAVFGGYITEEVERSRLGVSFVKEPAILTARAAGHRMFASQGFNWSLCGKVYRRSLFEQADFLDNWPISYGEDSYINYHLLKLMKNVAYVPVFGYHYRMRQGSMMHQGYHPQAIQYFSIYKEIIDETKHVDLELNRKALNVIYAIGFSLIEQILSEDSHLEDLQRIWSYLEDWRPNMEADWTDSLQWRWEYLRGLTPAEWSARRCYQEKEIRNFVQQAHCVFLYGTGRIGTYFADWIDEMHLSFEGFIETHPKKTMFRGKSVKFCEDFLKDDVKDYGILICMNEKHTKEVLASLRQAGIQHIMQGWKFCLDGR